MALIVQPVQFPEQGDKKPALTARDFERVTYMSATPIERKYWLEELMNMPEYRIE